MKEEWKPVIGYEGIYEVSNLGCVRSVSRIQCDGRRRKGKIRIQVKRGGIYKGILLYKDRIGKTYLVHRLVLEAFKGVASPGQQAMHKDGNSHNNNVDNLAWGTALENHNHKKLHGTTAFGEKNHSAKLNAEIVKKIRTSKEPGISLAKIYGVSAANISSIRKRQTWAHVL